mmetsp:Transcript_16662/g.23748  ORF Transcript_16662/g.23748 Transcript_16662/m.23748 type:complete len:125 (-) Transcript_16662:372-746(-)
MILNKALDMSFVERAETTSSQKFLPCSVSPFKCSSANSNKSNKFLDKKIFGCKESNRDLLASRDGEIRFEDFFNQMRGMLGFLNGLPVQVIKYQCTCNSHLDFVSNHSLLAPSALNESLASTTK